MSVGAERGGELARELLTALAISCSEKSTESVGALQRVLAECVDSDTLISLVHRLTHLAVLASTKAATLRLTAASRMRHVDVEKEFWPTVLAVVSDIVSEDRANANADRRQP
ncbi:MAG TPA: hypothetical protein VHD87_08150 [Acidimicrobiales bacterium]|nr:hypothetical protein [Acidimicrobiales bacterium]